VKDGKLQFLSVSSVEKFVGEYGCPVAWGYQYIEGIREPSTAAKEKGNASHENLQHFMSTGEDMLGNIERAGKHLVYPALDEASGPGPGAGLIVENESLGDISVAGVPFYVRLDLANVRDYWINNEGEQRPQDSFEVNDWKTTGSIEKKAKTGRELLLTVQMPIYGHWALKGGGGLLPRGYGDVRLSHTYFSTGKAGSLKSSVLASRQEIDDRVGAIAETVERMKLAAGAAKASDLEPRKETCRKTAKGCFYLNVCPHGRDESESSFFASLFDNDSEEDAMSGFDAASFLSGLKNGNGPAAPAPAAQPAPAPPAAPVAAPAAQPAPAAPAGPWVALGLTQEAYEAMVKQAVAAKLAELQASASGAPALAGPAAVAAGAQPNAGLAGNGPAGATTVTDPAALLATPSQPAAAPVLPIVPPDAPASGVTAPKAEAIPAEQLAGMAPEIQAAHAAVVPQAAQAPVPAAATAVTVTVVSNQIDPAVQITPNDPAQPTVVQNAAVSVAPPASPPAEAPKKRGRPPKAKPAGETSSASAADGIYLFVDCVPHGFDATSLDEYIDTACADIAGAVPGCVDIRCAPEGSPLAFGKWKGFLAGYVRKAPPAPGAYTVFVDGSEIRQVVVEALRSIAVGGAKGVR
jgi:hypothetical protein